MILMSYSSSVYKNNSVLIFLQKKKKSEMNLTGME